MGTGYLIVALAIMLLEGFYYGIRWGRGNKQGGIALYELHMGWPWLFVCQFRCFVNLPNVCCIIPLTFLYWLVFCLAWLENFSWDVPLMK